MKTLNKLPIRSLFAAFGIVATFFASEADAQMTRNIVSSPVGKEIRSLPYTISQPGLYYIKKNLTNVGQSNGITVEASQVTIELNGFSLIGTADGWNGVYAAQGTRDLVIRNGVIRNWGEDGIDASEASGTVVEDMKLVSNLSAGFEGNHHCSVRRSTASGNGTYGIDVEDHALIVDTQADNNGSHGINADDHFVLRGVRSSLNADQGFYADEYGTVSDSVFIGNGASGVYTDVSVTLNGCVAEGNVFMGFKGLYGHVWSNCTAKDNGSYGFETNANGRMSGCTASGNRRGFLASRGNIVEECVAAENTEHGIMIEGPAVVRNNSCRANQLAGIYGYVDNSRVEGNHLVGNAKGLELTAGTTGNMVFGNSASANSIANYDIAPGNDDAPIATVKTATSFWVNLSL